MTKYVNKMLLKYIALNYSISSILSGSGKKKNNDEGKKNCCPCGKKNKNNGIGKEQDDTKKEDEKKGKDPKLEKIKEEYNKKFTTLKTLFDSNKDKFGNDNNWEEKFNNLSNSIKNISKEQEKDKINKEIAELEGKLLSSINQKLDSELADITKDFVKYQDLTLLEINFEKIEIIGLNITDLNDNKIVDIYNKLNTFKIDFNNKKKTFITKVKDELYKKINEFNNKETNKNEQITLPDSNELNDIEVIKEKVSEFEIKDADKSGRLKDLCTKRITNFKSKINSINLEDKNSILTELTNYENMHNPSKEDLEKLDKFIAEKGKEIDKYKEQKINEDRKIFTKLKFVYDYLEPINEIGKIEDLKGDNFTPDTTKINGIKVNVSNALKNYIEKVNKQNEKYVAQINSLNKNKENIDSYKIKECTIENIPDEYFNDLKFKVEKLKESLSVEIVSYNTSIENINNNVNLLNKINNVLLGSNDKKFEKIETIKTDDNGNYTSEGDYSSEVKQKDDIVKDIEDYIKEINIILILNSIERYISLNESNQLQISKIESGTYDNNNQFKFSCGTQEILNEDIINQYIYFKTKSINDLITERNTKNKKNYKIIKKLKEEDNIDVYFTNYEITPEDSYIKILERLNNFVKLFVDEKGKISVLNKDNGVENFYYVENKTQILTNQVKGNYIKDTEFKFAYFYITNFILDLYAYMNGSALSNPTCFTINKVDNNMVEYYYIPINFVKFLKNCFKQTYDPNFVKIKINCADIIDEINIPSLMINNLRGRDLNNDLKFWINSVLKEKGIFKNDSEINIDNFNIFNHHKKDLFFNDSNPYISLFFNRKNGFIYIGYLDQQSDNVQFYNTEIQLNNFPKNTEILGRHNDLKKK